MRIVIIGTGRLAQSLVKAISGTTVTIAGIAGRDPDRTRALARSCGAEAFTLKARAPEADLVLLAVSDDAIATVAPAIDAQGAVVAHTSGTTSLDVLQQHPHYGVLWPVQTFIGRDAVPLKDVPMVFEGSDDHSCTILRDFAMALGGRPIELGLEKRRLLHLAAVIAGNFPVALVREAGELLKDRDLSIDLLMPLWMTMARNVQELGPEKAQTGPAIRGDERTMQEHMRMLGNDPRSSALYEIMSRSIRERREQE
jgi:predicted short-subunit dehydrogenase-like oxidoreductase (DUF2520 family)